MFSAERCSIQCNRSSTLLPQDLAAVDPDMVSFCEKVVVSKPSIKGDRK